MLGQVGVLAPGNPDHPGGQVDAEHVDTARVQMGGDSSGAAADVSDRADTEGEASPDEVVDDRDVQRRLHAKARSSLP